MAAPLKTTKEWAALAAHYKEVEELHMRRLFEEDPGRFEQFSIKLNGEEGDVLLDYSKNIITERTMKLLFDLVRARGVEAMRDRMFSGEKINITEVCDKC